MSKTLTASEQAALLRYASALPKGHETRRAIIAAVSKTANAEYVGGATEREFQALEQELNKWVRGAGKVTVLRSEGISSGMDWTAVFDTEYAALKAFYVYRHSKPRFGKAAKGGWFLSIGGGFA